MAETSSSTSKETELQEEAVVSMVDVLEEEKQYEEDANAVLGGSDPYQCTYKRGYLPRQALYACATCVQPDMEPAGICLACSLDCHDGHTLYELYTKRNFRCDCGNSKFPGMTCKLFPERDNLNEKNRYSQNFRGKYCKCARPYPDPEDDTEDEMFQCIMCEDWYHGRHTGLDVLPEDYDEFVCEGCCKACDFLYIFATLFPQQNATPQIVMQKSSEDTKVDVVSMPGISGNGNFNERDSDVKNGEKNEERRDSMKSSAKPNGVEKNMTDNTIVSGENSTVVGQKEECLLEKLKKNGTNQPTIGGRFWPSGWRSRLCACSTCIDLYKEKGASFLTDEKDTITEYENKGKAGGDVNQYEQGLQALQSIDRTQQVEVLTEYASMKDKLTEYLKKFADNKKVVREEDIKEFFEGLKANKKQRTGLQYFCR